MNNEKTESSEKVVNIKKGDELVDAMLTTPEKRTARQQKAEAKHRAKTEEYNQKRLKDLNDKLVLGAIQLVGGMKRAPWCVRFSTCMEIMFRLQNKDYNELGEWVGKPEKEFALPWCTVLANTLFFWRKVKTKKLFQGNEEVKLSGSQEEIAKGDK